MSKIYYVSDYHFFHELALKRSRSDCFNSIEEMNEEIIKRHNEKVNEDDDIYILGDIIVCEESELKDKLESTVGKLKGNLHLILGNHDYKFRENKDFLKYFKSVDELRLIRDHNKWVQLCHYPILLWYRKNKGAYHIFGHMHNDSCTKEFHHIKKENNIFNCCVEINNFEPCTLDELIENNNKFYEKMTKSTE